MYSDTLIWSSQLYSLRRLPGTILVSLLRCFSTFVRLKGVFTTNRVPTPYDEFAVMLTISSLTQCYMASESIGSFCTSFATIRAGGDCIMISFLLGSDGLALVSAVRLSLLFQLNIDSLHIDKEVLI